MSIQGKKATTRDVARVAGVSQSAVSMILGNRVASSFSEATVRRVREAAQELGYTAGPPRAAQGGFLHGAVAVVSPVLSNPYYAMVVQSIERAARPCGYNSVLFTTYRSAEYERQLIGMLSAAGPGGVIFTNSPYNPELVGELGRRVPVVVIGDRDSSIGVDTVEVNSFQAGVLVAEHLMGLGHRSAAFLSTTLEEAHSIRLHRLEGVRGVFESRGGRVVVKSRAVTTAMDISDPDIEHKVGYELTLECLRCEEVSAFIGVNDMVCYGILDALADMRKSIPGDFSVCGFDNIFPSTLGCVGLTSIENLMLQRGENAFQMLRRRMEARGPEDGGIARVEFPPRLIIRGSTGPVSQPIYLTEE